MNIVGRAEDEEELVVDAREGKPRDDGWHDKLRLCATNFRVEFSQYLCLKRLMAHACKRMYIWCELWRNSLIARLFLWSSNSKSKPSCTKTTYNTPTNEITQTSRIHKHTRHRQCTIDSTTLKINLIAAVLRRVRLRPHDQLQVQLHFPILEWHWAVTLSSPTDAINIQVPKTTKCVWSEALASVRSVWCGVQHCVCATWTKPEQFCENWVEIACAHRV